MAARPRSYPRGGILLGLALSLFAAGAAAEVPLKPDHPTRYVVRHGDTLWDIAGRFLHEPWRWGEIWQANPDIGDPDLIYPGDVLVLTWVDGEPRIGRAGGGMRTVKLTPRVRVEALDRAIPVVPANVIAPFLSQAYVLDKVEMDAAPYVVGFPEEHIVAGLADSIYVRTIATGEVDSFDIIRPGPAYVDPDTEEVLGYEAAYVANAELERPGDPARLRIERSEVEVAVGDRLIPANESEPLRRLEPRAAPSGLRGRIIGVLNGVTQIGQYNVVVLNRGSADGVASGHVFAVYQGGEERPDDVKGGLADWRNWRDESPLNAEFWYDKYRVVDWHDGRPGEDTPVPPHVVARKPVATYVAPYERSGLLLVFRAFPRVSFALVMDAQRPMKVLDSVGAPET
ncbi:LysM peptidoglycan-binding domain-containing protein [Thiococcus pfennigii]|uniref:LysM peptidoglycan-binding domain-containing protein n=1 Tax=Thiococcus pfennigii TaxID=1057 RepID=UPI0019052C23|nr:LysM domain-containing protein [Thiococcus pfennigii]MBK1702664.1 peptidoglycan-binding protein [Thiococcus pfennigii]MBK1731970.1 peptidoglycan-binding protein [Thiococcus pfennigii]